MDEALDVVTRLWAGEPIAEPGRFWDTAGLTLDPRPVRQPLPVWVGGSERSIERAARFGSAWMPLFTSPASVRDLRTKLDEAAARHGRQLELAVMTCAVVSDDDRYIEREARPKLLELASFDGAPDDPEACVVSGPPAACVEQVHRLFEAGADYVVLDFQLFGLESPAFAREQMSRFADVSGS